MLILKTLALEPMHGYGVAARIDQMSGGIFRVNAGSLFVAFEGYCAVERSRANGRQRKISRRAKYLLADRTGRKRLESETREWTKQVGGDCQNLEAS